jgi:hypothetical protein
MRVYPQPGIDYKALYPESTRCPEQSGRNQCLLERGHEGSHQWKKRVKHKAYCVHDIVTRTGFGTTTRAPIITEVDRLKDAPGLVEGAGKLKGVRKNKQGKVTLWETRYRNDRGEGILRVHKTGVKVRGLVHPTVPETAPQKQFLTVPRKVVGWQCEVCGDRFTDQHEVIDHLVVQHDRLDPRAEEQIEDRPRAELDVHYDEKKDEDGSVVSYRCLVCFRTPKKVREEMNWKRTYRQKTEHGILSHLAEIHSIGYHYDIPDHPARHAAAERLAPKREKFCPACRRALRPTEFLRVNDFNWMVQTEWIYGGETREELEAGGLREGERRVPVEKADRWSCSACPRTKYSSLEKWDAHHGKKHNFDSEVHAVGLVGAKQVTLPAHWVKTDIQLQRTPTKDEKGKVIRDAEYFHECLEMVIRRLRRTEERKYVSVEMRRGRILATFVPFITQKHPKLNLLFACPICQTKTTRWKRYRSFTKHIREMRAKEEKAWEAAGRKKTRILLTQKRHHDKSIYPEVTNLTEPDRWAEIKQRYRRQLGLTQKRGRGKWFIPDPTFGAKKERPKARIGRRAITIVDLDGTIADRSWREEQRDAESHSPRHVDTGCEKCDAAEKKYMIEPTFFHEDKPVKGSREYLVSVQTNIVYLTARRLLPGEKPPTATHKWLSKHGFPEGRVIQRPSLSGDSQIAFKTRWLKEYGEKFDVTHIANTGADKTASENAGVRFIKVETNHWSTELTPVTRPSPILPRRRREDMGGATTTGIVILGAAILGGGAAWLALKGAGVLSMNRGEDQGHSGKYWSGAGVGWEGDWAFDPMIGQRHPTESDLLYQ